MLAQDVTKTLPHPTEAGVTFTFRMLPGIELQAARDALVNAAIETQKKWGTEFVEMFQRRREEREQQLRVVDATDEPQDPNRFDAFDRATLLRHGVTGWTYDYPCDWEHIRGQDETTLEWAAREIHALSVRVETSEGKSSGSPNSTGPSMGPKALTIPSSG